MKLTHRDPRALTRQQLLGEHHEAHYAAGCIRKRTVKGLRWLRNMVRSGNMVEDVSARHDEVAEEMERRGYIHKSPISDGLVVEGGVEGE